MRERKKGTTSAGGEEKKVEFVLVFVGWSKNRPKRGREEAYYDLYKPNRGPTG